MALNTPFDYTQFLIGEELIFRALTQQRYFANRNEYGMTWNQADTDDRDDYAQKYDSARNHFTKVPQDCIPYPPCTWDKVNDKVSHAEFHDIIMLSDSSYSYRFRVHFRTDNGTVSFTIGSEAITYDPDQDALDASIRHQFRYFKKVTESSATDKAVLVIERMAGGTLDKTYFYLFDLD